MTFPVEWLHQWMLRPMYAGDTIKTWVDTIRMTEKQVGVRAQVYNDENLLAAVVDLGEVGQALGTHAQDNGDTRVVLPARGPG